VQPSIVQEIGEALLTLHHSQGLSVLVVEQNIDLMQHVAQRAYVLDMGAIVSTSARTKPCWPSISRSERNRPMLEPTEGSKTWLPDSIMGRRRLGADSDPVTHQLTEAVQGQFHYTIGGAEKGDVIAAMALPLPGDETSGTRKGRQEPAPRKVVTGS
jgi:hypothetical protein